MIVCHNLTGMTYLQFFGHNASLKLKNILETNETSFASYSLNQKIWSNFNLQWPDA